MKLKGSAGTALRRNGMISLMRPAAGGESRNRHSFLSYSSIRFYGKISSCGQGSLSPCHAIHTQYHPGNIRCLIRCQKYESIGNIFRLSQTAKRNLSDQRIYDFPGNGFHHIRLGDTRSHGIDTMIPFGPSSRARDRVNPLTANLDAG